MALVILKHPVEADDLARRLATELEKPVAVVTMGSPWRGDDAAAIEVARRWPQGAEARLFNVETAPESFLVPIATCGARSCLLIDAVDAGAAPGDLVLLGPEDLEHTDFSTHGLSPKAFLQALREMSGMHLVVLGIQPGPLREGEALSPAVERAVGTIRAALERLRRGNSGGTHDRDAPAGRTSGPDPQRT